MNRIIQIITIFSVIYFLVFGVFGLSVCSAQDTMVKNIATNAGYSPATDISLSEQVGRIIKGMLVLVGTIFLALTVYSGILWMTASGNDDQVSKATSILKAAVIGLILVTAAYSITAFTVGVLNPGEPPKTGGK